MARYIIGRLFGVVGVLIAVSIVTFLLMHAVPGGPFDAGEKREIPLSEAQRAEMMRKYHLDEPLYTQYLSYMKGVVQGDFGTSFHFGEPITTFLARSWPVTIKLGLITLAVSLVLGLGMGIAAALKPGSWLDMITSVAIVTFIVAPTFVVAILFIIVFSVKLQWLPSGGWGTPKQLIMPVIAYALGPTATIARYTRASMLEALRAGYVRTAQAKGLTSRSVVLRHAFRNALIPILTVVGPLVAWMVTGSFFVESIFRIPGIGNQLTLSIYNRDYPVIMAMSLIWCAIIALSYLATDLLYAAVDPRVRLTGGNR
jgi:ABC-type dipeptide/oligopeptide/nickel transport system permease component